MISNELIKKEMAEEEVKVLQTWVSFFAMRVVIGLKEKGVKYECIEENLSNKSDLLLTSNPVYKKIPVLIHNGKSVCESNIILQYIDEAWPAKSSFMPSDPYKRSQTRFWADFIDKKIYAEGVWIVMINKGEAQEEGKRKLMEYLKILEGVLGEKDYFEGDEFGYLDISFIPFTSWFSALAAAGNWIISWETEFPKLSEWAKRCMQRESVKEALPSPRKVVEYLLYVREKKFHL